MGTITQGGGWCKRVNSGAGDRMTGGQDDGMAGVGRDSVEPAQAFWKPGIGNLVLETWNPARTPSRLNCALPFTAVGLGLNAFVPLSA